MGTEPGRGIGLFIVQALLRGRVSAAANKNGLVDFLERTLINFIDDLYYFS